MSNELTRLLRTGVQALVAMAVAWLASTYAIDLEVDAVMIVVFPVVMALVTGVVKAVSERLPFLGDLVGLLNGPRRQVSYLEAPVGEST